MTDRAADLYSDSVGEASGIADGQVEAVEAQLQQVEYGNQLLDSLDRKQRDVVEPHLQRIRLAKDQVLEEEGTRARFLYFPVDVAVSVEVGSGMRALQLALLGREGLIGSSLLVGGIPMCRASVLFEGSAWRMRAEVLDGCLESCPNLHRQLLLGVNDFLRRVSVNAWGNALGTIENRVASWLLTAADCLNRDQIPLTHQMLAGALGVRRPSVTITLHALARKEAIRTRRGYLRILDRQRLAAVAGDYALQKAARGAGLLRP